MGYTKKNKPKAKVTQWQLEEIKLCRRDPVYFIKRYLKIQHPVRGRIPFNLFSFQEDVIKTIQEKRFVIVLKSRQLGLSTTNAAYALWLALFQRDKRILIMANNLNTAREIVAMIRLAFNDLNYDAPWLTSALDVTDPNADSKSELALTNGSRIEAIATSKNAGRGKAVSLLIIDEAAVIDDIEETYESIFSVVSEGGKIVIFSTPKGVGNFYHKLWCDAEENASKPIPNPDKYFPIKLPWTVHPEHDQAWFERNTANMTERQIQQEMNTSFLGSGITFFRPEVIEELEKYIEDPIAFYGPTLETMPDMWCWEEPKENNEYILCADVATGLGEDFSAFHIINKNTSEVDSEYMGKIALDDYARYLVLIAQKYNEAMIIQEKNSVGAATAMKLKELGYNKLFWQNVTEDMFDYLTEEQKNMKLPGFTTTQKNRDEILSYLEVVMRTKKIRVRSRRLIEQIKTFNFTNNKAKAAKGKNDDLIMALAIGCHIFKPDGKHKNNVSKSEWTKAYIESLQRANAPMKYGQSLPQRSSLFSPASNATRIMPGVMPVYVPQQARKLPEGQVVGRELTKEQRGGILTDEAKMSLMWSEFFR